MSVDATTPTSTGDLLRSATGVSSSWPRGAAFLVRMALEQAIAEFWERKCPDLNDCSMRAQLICIRDHVTPEAAARLAVAWEGLSEACHYHTYELAPTVAELRRWRDDVEDIVRRLAHDSE